MWAAVSRARQRAGRRLGYRGGALLICGVAWITYGLGLLADPRFGIVRGVSALSHLGPIQVPFTVWGWVWIGSGVASCCAAVLRARQDWWGWAAASAMPGAWAVAYSCARALGTLSQGWYSGITWAAFPGLLAILAAATRHIVYLTREVGRLRQIEAQNREAHHG